VHGVASAGWSQGPIGPGQGIHACGGRLRWGDLAPPAVWRRSHAGEPAFAALPEFDVWVWIYAAEAGAAAALGIASLPAFWLLVQDTGRRASALAVGAWPALGVLIALFGPQAVGDPPLWLAPARSTVINVIA
jgi:hypothetical protein